MLGVVKRLLQFPWFAQHLLTRDVDVRNPRLCGGGLSQHGDPDTERPPDENSRWDGELVLGQELSLLQGQADHLLDDALGPFQATDVVPGQSRFFYLVIDTVEFSMQAGLLSVLRIAKEEYGSKQ
jgi:hypothetical protein